MCVIFEPVSTHPANIRLGEVVLKTSWRCLQCNIFFVFQDVLKTSWRHNCKSFCKNVLKTSWRRFRKTHCKYVFKTFSRRLQDLLEDEKCYAADVFKTSWRCLGKQEMFAGHHLGLKTELWKPNIYIQYIIIASCKDFWKLSSLFMYFFTHTNIVFLFRHLPIEIDIFITGWSVSVVIVSFFRSRFC